MIEIIPETYIQDPNKAWDVAHASQKERYTAVGSRLIDVAMREIFTAEELAGYMSIGACGLAANSHRQDIDIVKRASLAKRIEEIGTVYPEALSGYTIYTRASNPTMYDQIPVVLGYGGLPIHQTNIGIYKLNVEGFDEIAEEKEKIAAALYDHPLSEEYIEQHRDVFRGRLTATVEEVFGLRERADYNTERAREYRDNADGLLSRLNNDEFEGIKFNFAIDVLLNRVSSELKNHFKNTSFEQRAKAMLNDNQTTLNDIVALIAEGFEEIIKSYNDKSASYQNMYEQIVNGSTDK